jgi:hypothetical protein
MPLESCNTLSQQSGSRPYSKQDSAVRSLVSYLLVLLPTDLATDGQHCSRCS